MTEYVPIASRSATIAARDVKRRQEVNVIMNLEQEKLTRSQQNASPAVSADGYHHAPPARANGLSILVQCSWCGRIAGKRGSPAGATGWIKHDERTMIPDDPQRVTHGICDDCTAAFLAPD